MITKYGTYTLWECNNCHRTISCLIDENPECDCQLSGKTASQDKLGKIIIYGYTRRRDLEELEETADE